MTEQKKEEKPKLTESEVHELAEIDYSKSSRWYADSGELLQKAGELLDQGIHPTVVVSGYRKALEKAREVLDEIGISVNLEDRETLKKIALTSMGSKTVGEAKDHLSKIALASDAQNNSNYEKNE